MGVEFLLIIILSILVLLLGGLLFARYRKESGQLSVLEKMSLPEFAEFLRSNSVDGNIQAVAKKVSNLLTNSFGCERIIFLRKKRGHLELNYYNGITKFNRKDFQITYGDGLAQKLSASFLPMKLEMLKGAVSPEYYKLLESFGVDVYFSIYWRDNLYGIYFVKSNMEVRTPAFTLLVASMAQSLSAAYHIKWHESRVSNLEKKIGTNAKFPNRDKEAVQKEDVSESRFLNLISIRNTDLLVPRIVNSLGDELRLSKFNFLYSEQSGNDAPGAVWKGTKKFASEPNSAALAGLYKKIKGQGIQSIVKVRESVPELSDWLNSLEKSGVDYVTDFALSKNRPGVLAFSGVKPTQAVKAKLKTYRRFTSELIENAEAYQKAELMSYTDGLTGLSNQRYMYKRLEEEINRAKRYSRPLAFIIFDIDELKNVNDTYGHLAGDALIKQVGQTLKKSIRAIDVVARYGGDEFCVVMPESDEETCVKFMARMIQTIANSPIKLPDLAKPTNCTVSMGAALYPEHAGEAQKLIYAADMALLKAKGGGRNRYLTYSPESA